MGFGNGAFQAARIAIDGVTIIENITTGKISATGTGVKSYLSIPIINNQSVATPAPFQQMIQLNLSQYPQLQGIASDLSNIYFSSDEAGNNKLYSWRETPASLTSTQTWWVLLPNGIPASGAITIFLQVSNGPALDGVYTGEAPQLSSPYGQYDNGANVFTNYWNFAGTYLPASFTSGVSSDGTLTVNNGLTLGTSVWTSPSYAYIVSNSTYAPQQIVEFYMSGIPTSPGGLGGVSTDWGFSSGTNPLPDEGISNNFENLFGGAIYSAGGSYTYQLWVENTEVASSPTTGLNTGVYGIYINPVTLYYNYAVVLSSSASSPNNFYLLLGISSPGNNAYQPSGEEILVVWFRTRAYPPNGIMPTLQSLTASVTQYIITENANNWEAAQTFNASINPNISQTTLTGATAGSIVYSMPYQGTSYKKFVAYVSGYENDTTTAQTITFPTAFIYSPIIVVNSTGLTLSANTTTLTISAPDSTTTYTGWIIIEGY